VSHCQQCGACCAAYRVDFSVHELDDNGGSVPSGLAVEVNDGTLCRMRGTDHTPMRCAALTGKIGQRGRLRHLRMAAQPLPRAAVGQRRLRTGPRAARLPGAAPEL
jgi:hypothetical protein